MGWISVDDKMPAEEDGLCQLVVYLVPRFGLFTAEITVGYFDKPENYKNPEAAQGWLDWRSDEKILVTHWMRLPALPEPNRFDGMNQLEFKREFGDFRPNLGCVPQSTH